MQKQSTELLAEEVALLRRRLRELEERQAESTIAARALHDSEESYKRLLETAGSYRYHVNIRNGAAVSTQHGPGCLAVTGYSPDDYAANPNLWFSMILPEDRHFVLTHIARLLSGTTVPPLEHRIIDGRGKVRWVRNTMAAHVENGEVARYDGVVEDITERKTAELALRDSEEHLRYIIEHNPSAVAVFDKGLRYLFVSDRYLRDYKLAAEDVIGKAIFQVFPEIPQHFREAFRRCLEGNVEGSDDDSFVRLDGSVEYLRWECRPWYSAGGHIGGFVMYSDLITERKMVERELEEYRDHLEELVQRRTSELEESREQLRHAERLASMGNLAAGIAHEINNPIGGILLAAEYALRAVKDDTCITSQALTDIVEHARRCREIVRNVLKFAREATGAKEAADLHKVIEETMGLMMHEYLSERRCDIELKLTSQPLIIQMNQTEIAQVLFNLLRNSIEAGASRVILRTRKSAGWALIGVNDNGSGIEQTHMKFLFDPFFTTRAQKGGTGLGLSISHGIIRDHNGTIEVQSEPGKGTTITVRLPLFKAAATSIER